MKISNLSDADSCEENIKILDTDDPSFLGLVGHRQSYFILKRSIDIFITVVLLVLLSPLWILISLLLLLFSPGPIFFMQERVGAKRMNIGGRTYWKKITFYCWKFRTMNVGADTSIHQAYVQALIENDEGKITALQGEPTGVRKLIRDSRVTPLGKLLRKLSLDELPQFINVLRGEMSLVGPRPAIPYEVEMYKLWHMGRLKAQPGITGLQQIVSRSAAGFDEQVRMDIEYIERQSLWLDMMIILKTPFVILSTKGAE